MVKHHFRNTVRTTCSNMWKICAAVLLCVLLATATGKPCAVRNYGGSSIVCACNKTYCDSLDEFTDSEISSGKLVHYVSSKAGQRLEKLSGSFSSASARSDAGSSAVFTVEPSTTYQEMLGFGGALTDSTAHNIYTLSEQTRETLIQTYFGQGGAQYLFLRVNMGACDFSLKYYTYDDVAGDVTLTNFSLIDIDTKYKIPFVKQASKVRGQNLKLFTAPWSAPLWMKSSGSWFNGTLLEKYYETWANYIIKYLNEYKREGVEFWGLAPQNEPNVWHNNYPVMSWSIAQLNEFVGKHLGPNLNKTGHGGLKMMALDDNRNHLPVWADRIFSDTTAGPYYSGVAVHWYADYKTDPQLLTTTHQRHPTKFQFYTEACNLVKVVPHNYGDWEIGEKYGTSMMQAFNNWVSGWTDWNLVVNLNGGPATFSGNSVDYGYNAAILVNATGDEFYKQPPYYFQAHFSMFVPPGSKRIGLTSSSDGGLANVAFLTPEKEYVIVFINSNTTAISTVIHHASKGSISMELPAESINTIVYK